MRRKTREERTWERFLTAVRMVLVAVFLCVLLLVLGLDSGPVPGAMVDEGAAVFDAAQEYDRVMEIYGDRVGAEACAAVVYEKEME